MGEASCVFQDFSLASQPSTSQRMASALSALGESVSFGRFLSESLDWGRWSSFNQRKYIEEAERYSKPGSVAQKKAFFEARYKKGAHLRRSIASMEHTTPTEIDDFDRESDIGCGYSKDDSVSRGREESMVCSFYSAKGDSLTSELREEEGEVEVQKGEEEVGRVIEDSGFVDSCSEKIVNCEMEKTTSSSQGKQPLQESSVTNQPRDYSKEEVPRTPNLEATKIPKPFKFSPSPGSNKASHLHSTKENFSSSSGITSQEGNSVERKRWTPKSMHMSINHPIGEDTTPSKADIKTKIAKFEAASKTSQSSTFHSKAAKQGFSKFVPKFAPQTPQSESRKMTAAEFGNPSTENSKAARNKVNRFHGETSFTFSRKSEKKEEKKEMAENELRELRRSLCFKAKPLPDFYRKTEPIKESNKEITPRISTCKEKLGQNNSSVSSQKPPLSRASSCKSSTAAAPTVASFSKDQNKKWTFTFSRR